MADPDAGRPRARHEALGPCRRRAARRRRLRRRVRGRPDRRLPRHRVAHPRPAARAPSPAASAAASSSPASSSPAPRPCSSTSRPTTSTPTRSCGCATSSSPTAAASSSSATTTPCSSRPSTRSSTSTPTARVIDIYNMGWKNYLSQRETDERRRKRERANAETQGQDPHRPGQPDAGQGEQGDRRPVDAQARREDDGRARGRARRRQGGPDQVPRARVVRQDPDHRRASCPSRTARSRSSPTSTSPSTGAAGS